MRMPLSRAMHSQFEHTKNLESGHATGHLCVLRSLGSKRKSSGHDSFSLVEISPSETQVPAKAGMQRHSPRLSVST